MTSTGQEAVAQALTTGLTADAFWGALLPFMGVVVLITLVSFGIYTVRRLVKGASRGKARI